MFSYQINVDFGELPGISSIHFLHNSEFFVLFFLILWSFFSWCWLASHIHTDKSLFMVQSPTWTRIIWTPEYFILFKPLFLMEKKIYVIDWKTTVCLAKSVIQATVAIPFTSCSKDVLLCSSVTLSKKVSEKWELLCEL